MVETKKKFLREIAQAIVDFDEERVRAETKEAFEAGVTPYEIIMEGMAKGMEVVGEKYESMEYFLPELVMAGEAMKAGMEILKPHLEAGEEKPVGKIVIGTVKGDLHDIGKNIVVSMLIGGGFRVHDLGVDVPPEKFLEKVEEVEADIVGLSALLLTTMPEMKVVIDEFKKSGLRDKVKVIVGGRPVTHEFAVEIGADAYAKDATEVVRKAKELTQRKIS